MRFRNVLKFVLCAAVLVSASFAPASARVASAAPVQGSPAQGNAAQRIEVMRSRLEAMRRTLNSAIAGLNAKDSDKSGAEEARARLSGLEKEVSSVLSEVNDVRAKQERAERYDQEILGKLETSVNDIDTRVQAGMRATIGERSISATEDTKKKKDGRGFFSRILGMGGDKKYDELIGTVAPGRDRQLFEDAVKEARRSNFETARALFGVIINTYTDSVFLPLAKLAIADTFYLEGTTSSLIQAAQAYQDWLTFFPTDPLADDVMLKIAEVEMRRMGLPDRDITNAVKARQRLRVLLQQFPKTSLRPEAEVKLREVENNLASHNMFVGDQYFNRYLRGVASNPKGAQSRYREIVELYPNYDRLDQTLYRLAQTYVFEEEPDEAAKYLQQLVSNFPNSEFVEKAREQLTAIGAPTPEVNKNRVNYRPPPGPGMFGKFKEQVFGMTAVTVDKDGILISNDSKGGDRMEEVLRRGDGTAPDTTPAQRVAPARIVTPAPPAQQTQQKNTPTIQPTQPGAPASGSDPARSPATQPVTPATPPPTSGARP
jgi:outer membrane protein assembly factor BamD